MKTIFSLNLIWKIKKIIFIYFTKKIICFFLVVFGDLSSRIFKENYQKNNALHEEKNKKNKIHHKIVFFFNLLYKF